jgi:hypothetical protein
VNVPSATVNVPNTVISITITGTPGTGYIFERFVIDGVDNSSNPATTPISGDMILNAVFTPVAPMTKYYHITATSDAGSSITPSGAVQVAGGSSQTFRFSALQGFMIASVKVDGIALTEAQIASGLYTFYNVNMDHTIEVTSTVSPLRDDIPLTIDITGNGYAEYSINGSGYVRYTQMVLLKSGDSVKVHAVASDGSEFAKWETPNGTNMSQELSIGNITAPTHLSLYFSSGSVSDNGMNWLLIAIVALIILAVLLLLFFVLFYHRSYAVVKVASSANIIGKDRARRKKPYKFSIEGGSSGTVSYKVGEDGAWKALLPDQEGNYVVPKGEVIDKLTIEQR